MEKWSKERAWAWYDAQPWIRGYCTYPSNCVNRIAMWQEHRHDEVMAQLDYEFALAAETGFNAVRAIVQFDVWLYQHDSFMRNLEDYISVADKHGQKVMLVIGNDCTVAKSRWKPPVFGEQRVDWGYHSGIKGGQHAGDYREPGYMLADDGELLPRFYEMIDEIAAAYAKDTRVQIWDVWNEIGNSNRGVMSVEMMKRAFEIIRSHEPVQPLTACVWRSREAMHGEFSAEELAALELSDIISFHCYMSFPDTVAMIEVLKSRFGRPMVCTEWLHRIEHNEVEQIFPLFYLEKIGSYHWGLVAGYSQTYEPWGRYYNDMDNPRYDLSKWQHDIFRFNGKPYDAAEIRVFKRFSALAKEREQ